MKTEYEVKVSNINYPELVDKLQQLWWIQLQEKTLFKRVAFRHPIKEHNAYIRVRDEGSQITCSYKEVDKTKEIDAVKEIEFVVDDFQTCVQFLQAVGLEQKAYQETYREIRDLDGVQITFDERPGLQPFMEIEWPSAEVVAQTMNALSCKDENVIYGAVDEIYFQELWIPHHIINNMKLITFENPPVECKE